MSPLIVLLAVVLGGQAESPPTRRSSRWVVPAFTARYGSDEGYGTLAASALVSELRATGHEFVTPEAVTKAAAALRLSQPPRPSEIRALGALTRKDSSLDDTILIGEVSRTTIFSSRGGLWQGAGLRLVAYDAASGLPVAGAAVRQSESKVYVAGGERQATEEAIRKAASSLAKALLAHGMPRATILNTTGRVPLINGGEADGFWPGTPVVVVRGGQQVIGVAHVAEAEAEQAVLVFDRIDADWAPGDRVRALFRPLYRLD